MDESATPTHDLADVKEKIRVGFVTYSNGALDGAAELEFGPQDVRDCMLALQLSDFYKTMPAERWKGAMQDVYRPAHLGVQLYVKFQMWPGQRLHVVSFKRRNQYDNDD